MSTGLQSLDDETLISIIDSQPIGEGNYEENSLLELAQIKASDSVDTRTGAPANVRASVGAAQTQEDKLTTLRRFYPDAIPVEIFDPKYGATKFGKGNYIFTSPETNQLQTFDEDFRIFGWSAPSLRDFLDFGPEVAETVGAIAGGVTLAGIAGAAASPTVGGVIPAATAGYIVGEGLGSAAAREAYIGILDFFGETEDTRSGGERATDIGTTIGINAVGGPVVSKLLQGVKYVFGQPIRWATGALSTDAKTTLKRMENVSVTDPTAGQVTGSPVVQLAEQALSVAPTSTRIMQDAANQTIAQVDTFAKELAEKYGGIRTTSEAAQKLMSSAQRARTVYDNQVTKLYNDVGKHIPDDLVSDAKHTTDFVNKYIADAKTATGGPEVNPALRQAERVLQDAKDGVLTYSRLKAFRTSLMNTNRKAAAMGGLSGPEAKSKELIGYVTQDLDSLVAKADNPNALKLYKKANTFVKQNMKKGGNIAYIDNVIKKGETRATNALNHVLSGAKDGGEDLLKLRQLLDPDEFSVMSGYMLGKMGVPTPAVSGAAELSEQAIKEGSEYIAEQGFSPKTFITNWNKLSKEAKEVLFKGTEYADLVPALDDLVFTIDRIGKSASAMANPSGTARVGFAMGTFGMMGADVGLGRLFGSEGFEYGMSALVAPYMSANLLTNKSFVRWLAEGAEKAVYNPESWGQHVRRLYQIYELNPDIREEVRAILGGLSQETIEPIEQQSSASYNLDAPLAKNTMRFRQAVPSTIANEVLPDNTQLAENIDAVQVPQIDQPLFEPESDLAPTELLSPTIIPDPRDREIAMRRQLGIAGLV